MGLAGGPGVWARLAPPGLARSPGDFWGQFAGRFEVILGIALQAGLRGLAAEVDRKRT